MKKLFTIAVAALVASCGFDNAKKSQSNLGDLQIVSSTSFKVAMTGGDELRELEATSAPNATDPNTHIAELAGVPVGSYAAVLTPDDVKLQQVRMTVNVTFGQNKPVLISFPSVGADNQAVLDAIAALQAAINSGDPNSIATALANLMTAINGVNGAVGDLADDIAALQAQALSLMHPGKVKVSCTSGNTPLSGCLIVETNQSYALNGAGDDQPRSCTTDASGSCEIRYLDLNVPLIFAATANSMGTEHFPITLTNSVIQLVEFKMKSACLSGSLLWWNHAINVGASRDITGEVMQCQADGTLLVVDASDGLSCAITSGASNVSVDIDCTLLSGLAVGCGKVTASKAGATSADSVVRVLGAGAPETCAP